MRSRRRPIRIHCNPTSSNKSAFSTTIRALRRKRFASGMISGCSKGSFPLRKRQGTSQPASNAGTGFVPTIALTSSDGRYSDSASQPTSFCVGAGGGSSGSFSRYSSVGRNFQEGAMCSHVQIAQSPTCKIGRSTAQRFTMPTLDTGQALSGHRLLCEEGAEESGDRMISDRLK